MTELDQLRAQLAEAQAEIERLKAEADPEALHIAYLHGQADRDQQLAEAQAEIEEWRGKHDVACLTITKLQKQYEGQLAATSKAMEASVDLLACQATNEKLREVVGLWIGIASNCAIESGCCHCGDSMDNHASPFVCGHSPVDMADTAVSHAIEKSDEALALPNDTTALAKQKGLTNG